MVTVALIPARGGSKSIPYKNIKIFCGRPLIYWAIDAAIESDSIDAVYISTDNELIKKSVNDYDKNTKGKLKVIERSEANAKDESSTESVIQEFSEKVVYDDLILIQATSPLLESKHLEEGIKIYKDDKYDSLLSVVEQKRFYWKESIGYVEPINYDYRKRPRRQEFEGTYVENGAFYINSYENIKEYNNRLSGRIGAYVMPEATYYEIDEESDWVIAEQLKYQSLKGNRKKGDIKLFIMDCDGVLTDAGMYYTKDGDVMKKFNTKDGMGVALLKQSNIKTAIITGENSNAVRKRAEKLGIDDIFLGCKDKVRAAVTLSEKYNVNFDEMAFIGDDINDLELLKKVGYSFSVADAMNSVKKQVHYVTKAKGGEGAVREAIEVIIGEVF